MYLIGAVDWSAISNVVVALAAVAAAWCAWRGVDTWRKQLVTTRRIDARHNVMVVLYRIADAISQARISPLNVSDEAMEEEKAKALSGDPFDRAALRVQAERLVQVDKLRAELRAAIIEAQIEFDTNLDDLSERIRHMRFRVFFAIRRHYQFATGRMDPKRLPPEKLQQLEADLEDMSAMGQPDDYVQELEGIFTEFKNRLTP